MKKRLLAALVAGVLGIATVALVAANPASAAGHAHVLGAKALHPQDYAQAKAAANAQAAQTKGGGGGGGTKGGGGGGKPSPSPSPSPGTIAWDGQYQSDLTPGDPTGAVGPTRYIELVNVKFGIYGRTGSLVASGSLNALTGASSGSSLSDPQILWDPLTQRFYYLVLNVSTNALMYGFSTTSSPSSTSDFCKYYFGTWNTAGNLPDYPKIGSTSDFILAGVNVFDSSGQTYQGSDVGWVTKPHVNGVPTSGALTGCSGFDALHSGNLAHLKNADGSDTATPVPAIQTDPTASGWVVGTDDATLKGSPNDYISVFSVTNNGGTPTIALAQTVAVPTFGVPASALQAGTSATIDTLDGRLEKAVSGVDPSNGGATGVWTAHAVFGGAGSEERWYEIDPASGSLLRSGKASDPATFIWNGAVSPDRSVPASLVGSFGGDMVMGYSVSSTSSYPAIAMVSLRAGGIQTAPVTVKSSNAGYVDFSCSPCRWGDYSSATPDPAASASGATGAVWLSGEYNTSGGGVFTAPWRSWNWAVSP